MRDLEEQNGLNRELDDLQWLVFRPRFKDSAGLSTIECARHLRNRMFSRRCLHRTLSDGFRPLPRRNHKPPHVANLGRRVKRGVKDC